jgi:hypothetical protein
MRKYHCLLPVLLLFSCSNKNSHLLVADTMKVVMWDMMRADELFSRLSAKDTVSSMEKRRQFNIRLYEEVFTLHHITKGSFDSTYRYYAARPVLLKQLLDSVDAYGSRQKTAQYGNFGQSK